MNVFQLEAEDE